MRLDVVSIFPDYLEPLRLSLPGKAIESGLVQLAVHDLRAWTHDRHRSVDDTPYGGGAGMVMRPEPWGEALDTLTQVDPATSPRLLIMTPSGRRFDQSLAAELAAEEHLIFACGRYEGIDERVAEYARSTMRVDEISIGDYVLNGGEVAALAIIEAIVRLIPGVLGNPESLAEESHSSGHDRLLEYPVYTKPPSWRGLDVPEVLFSGHHAQIAQWRRAQAVAKTRSRRPDLLPDDLQELVVGPIDARDAGELLTLQRAAYLGEARLNRSLDLPPLTQTLEELTDSLSEGTVLGARRGTRLVGSVRGHRTDEGGWYIGRLMVAPDLQGQGIGTLLMDKIESLMPADATRCELVTGTESEPNLAFYRRRGYVEISRRSHPGGVSVAIMTRPIASS